MSEIRATLLFNIIAVNYYSSSYFIRRINVFCLHRESIITLSFGSNQKYFYFIFVLFPGSLINFYHFTSGQGHHGQGRRRWRLVFMRDHDSTAIRDSPFKTATAVGGRENTKAAAKGQRAKHKGEVIIYLSSVFLQIIFIQKVLNRTSLFSYSICTIQATIRYLLHY